MWKYVCIACGKNIRERGGTCTKMTLAYCKPCTRTILAENFDAVDRLVGWHAGVLKEAQAMEGTQILPVREVATCSYSGCDEIPVPGLTACWRHRRVGVTIANLTPVVKPLFPSEAEEKMPDTGKCGCGREWNHRGRCAYRRAHPQNGQPARSIEISTAARDALNKRSNTFGDADVDAAELPTFTLKLTEPVMDALWGMLDGKSKAALLSKMGTD